MKTLKYLFIALILSVASTRQARALAIDPPYFSNLRVEITNQLTIASNTVPVNKPLISKLKSALKTLDKNTTNTIAPGTKTLVALTKALNKTTLSNIFDADLQFVIDIYTHNYQTANSDLITLLGTAFPGKKHDAAQKFLDKLQAAIAGADTNLDSNLACKALTLASKNLTASIKAVATAKNAPLPPASFSANIAISGSSASTFKATLAVATMPVVGNFFVNATGHTGSGFGTKLLSLSFSLADLVAGQNTVAIPVGGANQYTIGGLSGNASFISTGGTAHVSWVAGFKTITGDFSFNAGEQDGVRTAVISGTFTIIYL